MINGAEFRRLSLTPGLVFAHSLCGLAIIAIVYFVEVDFEVHSLVLSITMLIPGIALGLEAFLSGPPGKKWQFGDGSDRLDQMKAWIKFQSQYYNDLLNSAQQGYLLIDANNKVLCHNRKIKQILQCRKKEIINKFGVMTFKRSDLVDLQLPEN